MGATFFATEANTLAIVAVCLVFSAFFSSAETAITSLGILKVKHLIDQRGSRLAHMQLWLTHPGRVITTILLFNNIVNILASAVTTQLASKYFANSAIGIATGITTLLVLVFGEIVPKTFAKAHAERIAIFSMRIVLIAYFVSYPIVRSLSSFADFLIKLVSHGHKKEPLITEEEIEFLVNEGEKAGIIGEIKKDIIEGAFDFDETRVREIITPRTDLTAIDASSTYADAAALIVEHGHSRLPVFDTNIDNIVGLILAKDLLTFAISGRDTSTLTAKDIMREAFFVPESKTIMEVFKDLKRTKTHMAIIIDEYGGTAGVVTMEDILEEIVGDIQDEYDTEQAKIVRIDESSFEVLGSISIDEFTDYFDLRTEDLMQDDDKEPDVETLAGLLTHVVAEMPAVGQTIQLGPLRLEVMEVTHHRIDKVHVQRSLMPSKRVFTTHQ